MALTVVGISHHTASVEVRERFAFGEEEGRRTLVELRERSSVDEAVLLSTCNRTEMYLYPATEETLRLAESLLQRKAGALPAPVTEFLYRHWGADVPRHLFRVTSGLDSLVFGEAEIQGQVKSAYRSAIDHGPHDPLAGSVLNRLFQTALSVGGRVRAQTAIGEGAASVGSVAVELARKIFGQLGRKRVLVIGAGEAAGLVTEALEREGVEGILVTSRSYQNAADLAERFCGRAVELGDLASSLREVDIVVSSTSAPHAVLTSRTFREAYPDGMRGALLLIDIAIPRDIDPDVGDESNVFLYNIDDLRAIVDETLDRRRDAVVASERIIEEAAEEFVAWYAALEVVPIIRSLRSRAEEIRQAELERLLAKLDGQAPEVRAEIETFSRRFLNKLLHEPTVRVRARAADGRAAEAAEAARLLFGLGGTGVAEGRDQGASESPGDILNDDAEANGGE